MPRTPDPKSKASFVRSFPPSTPAGEIVSKAKSKGIKLALDNHKLQADLDPNAPHIHMTADYGNGTLIKIPCEACGESWFMEDEK